MTDSLRRAFRLPEPQSTPGTPTAAKATPSARPDPLAVTLANGTTFSAVDRAALAQEAAKALKLGADVPGRVQDGPTCGLYALGMVMDYWEVKDPTTAESPLVVDADTWRRDSHSLTPDTKYRLFDEAKKAGFTTQGEMFYARQLGQLAEQFGFKSKVTENFTVKDLHAAIDQGHPVLVAFDVDNHGNPGLFGGSRAHWAVIEGHFDKDGTEYLVATHGWTGKEYVWRADDLMASVNQLNASDFPAAPKDITKTLRGLMVEVTPKATA
ncbi:MAG: C39 family peptidase [Myxococcaceae bacterium]|nr:C39 family peptidase [Myxococcaceae bacterium]